jgi:hypothetical protein
LRRGRDASGIGTAGALASRGVVWYSAILDDAIG